MMRGIAITGAVSIFAIASATAAFKLRISADGGATFPVQITDEVAGDGAMGTPGVILWSGAVGGFNVVVNVAQSKPAIGAANMPQLDLNVTASTAGGAGGTLWMETTDTNYTGGGGSLVGVAGGTQPGGIISSVQWDTWTDSTNAEFGTGGLHVAMAPTNANPFGFSGAVNGVIAAPFSMTNRVQLTMRPNAGTITGDFNSQVVPEGSSLALVLPGLAPLGLILRRRMKKQ